MDGWVDLLVQSYQRTLLSYPKFHQEENLSIIRT